MQRTSLVAVDTLMNGDGGVVVQPDAGTSDAGTVDAGVGGVDAGVPAATPLSSGIPVSGLSGAANSQTFFSVWVPAGTPSLVVKLSGTSGDADLYVRSGQLPTSSTYECRPFTSTSTETCTFSNPRSGWWYVMVRGFSAYSAAGVTAIVGAGGGSDGGTPVTDGGTGPVLVRGVPVTMLAGATGASDIWRVELPSGVSQLTVSTSGGSGDVDVYVRAGQAPTTVTYQCASRSSTNRETCTVSNPSAGAWFVLLRGYSTYSGVALRAD